MDINMDWFSGQFQYQDLENTAIAIENDLPDDLLFLDVTSPPEITTKPEPISAQVPNSQSQHNEYHDPDVFQYIQQEEKLQQQQQQQQLLHQFNQQQQSNVAVQKEQYQNGVDANIIRNSENQISHQMNSLTQRGQYQNQNGHVDVNNFIRTDNRIETDQANLGQDQQKKPQQILQRQQITVQRQPLVVQRRQQPVQQAQQQVLQNRVQGTIPNQQKQIQKQLTMMLHSSKCLKREKEGAKNNEEFYCTVNFCSTMRNILSHMANCKINSHDCPQRHCFSFKQIIKHWFDCKSESCLICQPLRRAGEKFFAIPRNNISTNPSTTSVTPSINQYVNIQRLSG